MLKNYLLKNILIVIILLTSVSCISEKGNKPEKEGWNLSIQSYSFHLFSVMESLDKTRELGVKFIEIYPGQRLGEGFGEDVFGYNLSSEQRAKLIAAAKERDVKIISTGVWTAEREEWDKIFSFAKEIGVEFISAEPNREDWDVIEELVKKYNIKLAVHNHPNEKSYWNPAILLEHIGDRSKLIGSCADVGHYKRMGLDPIDCLHALDGRILSLHMKDILSKDAENPEEDTIWGQGVLNVEGILKELKSQNFKGYFTIEYEANWENSLPDIKKSIDYFNQKAEEIL